MRTNHPPQNDRSPARQRAGRRDEGWAPEYVGLPTAYVSEPGRGLRCALAMDGGGECGREAIGFLGVCERHRKRIRYGWPLARLGETFQRGSRAQPSPVIDDTTVLDAEIEAYIERLSLRPSTRRGYEADVEKTIRLLDKPVLECTPRDILDLIKMIVEAGLSASTLDGLLAAVTWAHRRAGRDSPTKNAAVIAAAKTARREATGKAVPRQPITPSIARALIGSPPLPSLPALRRAVTGLVAAAAPAATPHQLAHIHPVGDVTLSTTHATIRVGEATVTIAADPDAPGGRCPLALLRAWLERLPPVAASLLGPQLLGGTPTTSGYESVVRMDLATMGRRLRGPLGTDTWRIVAAADLVFVRWIYRRAVIAVGLALGSRVSDWREVKGTSVQRRGEARLITLGVTKTDRDGGTTLGLVPARREHALCPVAALDAWMRLARPGRGYLFGTMTSGGWRTDQLLEPNGVSRLLRQAAKDALARDPACGVEPARLSSRSLRCGFVVTALDDTADLRLIATTTLHKNVEYLGAYAAASETDRPARKLFTKGPRP